MEITLTLLEQEAPDLLKEIRDAARGEGLQAGREAGLRTGQVEGIQAERERVVKILGKAGLKGISLEVIQEGATYEAALEKFLEHQEQVKAEALKTLGAQAPPPVGQAAEVETYMPPASSEDLPIEKQALSEWEKDPKLAKEFGQFETYLAFRRNQAEGRVKILQKG